MRLIVGLGNPGPEYVKTRHNAGWLALERIEERHGLSPAGKVRFRSVVTEGQILGERCLLLRPQTFMNNSGLAVQEAVGFFKLDPQQDLMVLVDDVALPVGRIRLRASGSAGGHNGLADIERALGTANYPRLRIGIDPPGMIPQVDYVLGRFTAEQVEKLGPALEDTAAAIDCWIKMGLTKAMTEFNAE